MPVIFFGGEKILSLVFNLYILFAKDRRDLVTHPVYMGRKFDLPDIQNSSSADLWSQSSAFLVSSRDRAPRKLYRNNTQWKPGGLDAVVQ